MAAVFKLVEEWRLRISSSLNHSEVTVHHIYPPPRRSPEAVVFKLVEPDERLSEALLTEVLTDTRVTMAWHIRIASLHR